MTSLYIVYTNCILWTLSDNKVYLILSYLNDDAHQFYMSTCFLAILQGQRCWCSLAQYRGDPGSIPGSGIQAV